MSLPGLYRMSTSYCYRRSSTRCKPGGVLARLFFWICFRGLWSDSTTKRSMEAFTPKHYSKQFTLSVGVTLFSICRGFAGERCGFAILDQDCSYSNPGCVDLGGHMVVGLLTVSNTRCSDSLHTNVTHTKCDVARAMPPPLLP